MTTGDMLAEMEMVFFNLRNAHSSKLKIFNYFKTFRRV